MTLDRLPDLGFDPLTGKEDPPALPEPVQGLFTQTKAHDPACFALLDGARVTNLQEMLEQNDAQFAPLLEGDEPDMIAAGPYLVALSPDNAFTHRLFTASEAPWHLWDTARPALLRSTASLQDVLAHLRRLLRVRLPDGAFVMFRFWDVEILHDYLDACLKMPERAARIYGRQGDAPLITEILLPPPTPDTTAQDDAEPLNAKLQRFSLSAPLPAAPPEGVQQFDAVDVKILQKGLDRRMVAKLGVDLEKQFAKMAPDHADKGAAYADGALRFHRRHGAGQAIDLEKECFELAMMAFMLGPNWPTVRDGPLMQETLVPMPQRIALLRESYLEAMSHVPPEEM